MQKLKVSDRLVPTTDGDKQNDRQTDGGDCITCCADAVGKNEGNLTLLCYLCVVISFSSRLFKHSLLEQPNCLRKSL